MALSKSQRVFFDLLSSGLWEKEAHLSDYAEIDYEAIMLLAEEQSVIGLITVGLEQVKDVKIPQEWSLQFIGSTLQIEQRNKAMNAYLSKLVLRFKEEKIKALLVKGQGLAQCYMRPLWRACGDIDWLLDEENYNKAKYFLTGIAQEIHEENSFDKHFSVNLDGWEVELHGSMRSMLPKRADAQIDLIQDEAIQKGRHRVWDNDGAKITLPCPDDDIIFVFTHILKHFFHYGIGIRQVCDWCRLLYTYHKEMDLNYLEKRLKDMHLMTEWAVFGALAVNRLGMPSESMPLYSDSAKWKRKADRVLSFILKTGNFGHNRDNSRYASKGRIAQKVHSLWQHTCDSARHFFIFPVDAIRIWGRMVMMGLKRV